MSVGKATAGSLPSIIPITLWFASALPSLRAGCPAPLAVVKGDALQQVRIMCYFYFHKPAATSPFWTLPVQRLARQTLLATPNNSVYRFGHTTVLMKLDDGFREDGVHDGNWPQVHMRPEESLQAHLELKGRLRPIHNDTFDLSMHSWREPFDRIVSLGGGRGGPLKWAKP